MVVRAYEEQGSRGKGEFEDPVVLPVIAIGDVVGGHDDLPPDLSTMDSRARRYRRRRVSLQPKNSRRTRSVPSRTCGLSNSANSIASFMTPRALAHGSPRRGGGLGQLSNAYVGSYSTTAATRTLMSSTRGARLPGGRAMGLASCERLREHRHPPGQAALIGAGRTGGGGPAPRRFRRPRAGPSPHERTRSYCRRRSA